MMTDALSAMMANLIQACDEYNLLLKNGLSGEEIGDEISKALRKFPDQERIDRIWAALRALQPPEPPIDMPWPPIKKTIDRLLAEAPVLTNATGQAVPGQAPAIECMVMFGGGVPPVRGALSKTPEGNLRMLSPGMDGDRQMLAELFFDYSAVTAIVLTRATSADTRIFVPKPGRLS